LLAVDNDGGRVTILVMDTGHTTLAVQRYLDELAGLTGESPAEPIVSALLGRSVDRLHLLCSRLLHKNYPRLTRGPTNLRSEEMLSAVVERLMKAMRQVRPQTVRQFFALANKHVRWELNDLARRLDQQAPQAELRDSLQPAAAGPNSSSAAGPRTARILEAIDRLPEDEREVFELVRIQGMTHPEAAGVIGVSPKTVKRRLDRGLAILAEELADLRSPRPSSEPSAL
jgi:RNA polymerase sigma factor (sigma-70 family)